MTSHVNVLNSREAQKLMYSLIGKEQYFSTKRRLDFSEPLTNLTDRYVNGDILIDYPTSENFDVFLKSISMITGFDWKNLFVPNESHPLITGTFKKDDVVTTMNPDIVDLQTFIRIHEIGNVTLTSDNSAYLVTWNSKFEMGEITLITIGTFYNG